MSLAKVGSYRDATDNQPIGVPLVLQKRLPPHSLVEPVRFLYLSHLLRPWLFRIPTRSEEPFSTRWYLASRKSEVQ
jgi:hypothetical protein